MARRPRPRADLLYFPVSVLVLVPLLAFLVLVPFVVLRVGEILGLTALETFLAFFAVVVGSSVNLPLYAVETRVRRTPPPALPLMGWISEPRVRRRRTVVAVNVGGALVPAGLSAYFLWSLGPPGRVAALLATAAVSAAAYWASEPVPGMGMAVPALVPPLASVGAAGLAFGLVGAPVAGLARAAFAAGALGTLAGADLLHMDEIPALGAPVVSIGGAGTFDGIVLSGVISTLLAALLLGAG